MPALYFEPLSIERGPQFGMSQKVIDGHRETLDGVADISILQDRSRFITVMQGGIGKAGQVC